MVDFLYDQVKAGRMKIKNERDDLYDTFLITASTNESATIHSEIWK